MSSYVVGHQYIQPTFPMSTQSVIVQLQCDLNFLQTTPMSSVLVNITMSRSHLTYISYIPPLCLVYLCCINSILTKSSSHLTHMSYIPLLYLVYLCFINSPAYLWYPVFSFPVDWPLQTWWLALRGSTRLTLHSQRPFLSYTSSISWRKIKIN